MAASKCSQSKQAYNIATALITTCKSNWHEVINIATYSNSLCVTRYAKTHQLHTMAKNGFHHQSIAPSMNNICDNTTV